MTTQIAWTGSPPTAHSRCGEDESKAIEPARTELVDLEPDLHAERSARHVAVFPAAVRHQCVLGARRGSDRVHHVQELHVRVALMGETLPAHAGREVDHRSCLGAFREAVAPLDHALFRPFAEDVAHRHAELRDDGVQRADRRIDSVELDLGHEARRHAHPTCELAETDAEPLSFGAETMADLRALGTALE